MTTTGVTTPEQAARNWRDPLSRAGIFARGVLYLMLGALAINFAQGDTSSDEVSQTGAIETLAEQPFGKFLLLAMTVGLAAMCLWRLIQVAYGDPVEGDEPKDRVEYAVKAAIYGVLTFTSAKITIDNWSGGSSQQSGGGDDQQQQAASFVFDLPAGRWLVGLLGAVLIGVAVYEAWKQTVQAEFMERLTPPGQLHTPVEAFGRIGYAARSVVWFISGIFFVVAALQYDASESKGLSGSLQELADRDWGRIVLWGVALGLFLFGVFCLAESRYRRHT